MDQQFVMISREAVKHMLVQLHRSEGFCNQARPVSYPMTTEDLHAEPTEFYSGASGYAGATMRDVIQTLESHL